MRMWRQGIARASGVLLAGLLALVATGCAGSRGAGGLHVGPIYSEAPDFWGQEGVRVAGPLVERRISAEGDRFTAVRPFWSRIEDGAKDRSVADVLWPLGMFKMRQGELDWRFLTAFGHDFGREDEGPSRMRWSVFPFLFGGRDVGGNGYFCVFPLGGTLNEFLGRERIWFVLFPLFGKSLQDDNVTTSVLWPIYSRTRGGDISRWRVWPFYGVSHNGEAWTKRFVMWPVWTSVRYHEADEAGGGFILFPLYGQVDLPERKSRMLLPPFFKVEWGETGHFALNAPWPFLRYARNAELDLLYGFPLWGRKRMGQDHSWFAFWPIVSGQRVVRPGEEVKRLRVLPVWQSERVRARGEQAVEGVTKRHYMRFWPLGMYRSEAGQRLLRVPDLWPLRQTPAVERNWAPLWTLYRRDWNEERSVSEVLWGLVRWERGPQDGRLQVFPLLDRCKSEGRRSWRLLYGLLGYERDDLQRTYQLLYFMRIRRGQASAGESGKVGEQEGEEP